LKEEKKGWDEEEWRDVLGSGGSNLFGDIYPSAWVVTIPPPQILFLTTQLLLDCTPPKKILMFNIS
jgi:hypothetical protein